MLDLTGTKQWKVSCIYIHTKRRLFYVVTNLNHMSELLFAISIYIQLNDGTMRVRHEQN